MNEPGFSYSPPAPTSAEPSQESSPEEGMATERSFKRKQKEFFDALSSTFLRQPEDSDLLPAEYRETVLRALSETFPPDFRGRILDVGCGIGQNSLEIALLCPQSEVVGIDISIESLRKANAAARAAGISSRIDFVASDNERLPFRPGVFKGSMVIGVLHHSYNPDVVLSELIHVTTGAAKGRVVEPSMANIPRKLGWLFWDCIPQHIKGRMHDLGENRTLPDIIHLTPKNLKQSLETAGWRVSRLESKWLFIFLFEYLALLKPLRKLLAQQSVGVAHLVDRRLTSRGPFRLGGSFILAEVENPRRINPGEGENVP